MTRSLPPRPSLSSLKKRAKRLLKDTRDGNGKALEQVRLYFPFPDRFKNLRDAQLVIARSYGYPGWTDLVRAVDQTLRNTLSPDELADQLIDLACLQYAEQDSDLRVDRAARLLREHPQLSGRNFMTAIVSGNLGQVHKLLQEEPDLATRPASPRQWQPLMYLTYNRIAETGGERNAVKIARLLLDYGADPNAFVLLQKRYRFTVLTGVMGEGERGVVDQPPHQYAVELAKLLLEAGADPNECQGLYNTVFTRSGDFWLRLLVEYGLNKESRVNWDDSGNPGTMFDFLLTMAAGRDFPERVAYLLALGTDPNARCMYTGSAAHTIALTRGNHEIVQRLLDAGATPEALSAEDRFKAAVGNRDVETIKNLVGQKPALLNHPEWCQHADEAVLLLLMTLGLDVDRQDKEGKCLLHYMAANGNVEGVRCLLDRGARDDLRDYRHQGTPLGWAHFNHQPDVREVLLARSVNTNELAACGDLNRLEQVLRKNPALAKQASGTGNTPLHLVCNWLGAAAAYGVRAGIMDVLLQHGADINAVNRDGLTPLGLNREAHIEDNVALLLERGAR